MKKEIMRITLSIIILLNFISVFGQNEIIFKEPLKFEAIDKISSDVKKGATLWKIELPANVNFISWNYDRLFELSLSILLNSDLNEVREYVNIFNNYETIENKNKPYLIKLNGSAGAFIDSQYKKDAKEQIINEIIRTYKGTFFNAIPDSMIQFAWDENENTKKSRLKAIEIMNNTQILVVIGYSFPTFNRKIDKQLLSRLFKLERIILQNTKENIDSVTDRLRALIPEFEQKKLIKITDENEFHMPIEI